MDKEMAAEVFDTSMKNTHPFTTTTEEGNIIEGFICRNRKFNMGSLIINTVNGQLTEQYVQGMPKLTYLDKYSNVENPTPLLKVDGTCILAFPLLNKDNEVIEVCFKGRTPNMGIALLNKSFYNKTMECWTETHNKMVQKNALSFSFELYGTRNSHEVDYKPFDIELNLDLLCVLDKGRCLPARSLSQFPVKSVMKCFDVVGKDCLVAQLTNRFVCMFDGYLPPEFPHGETLEALYTNMEEYFELLNANFQKENQNRIATEGSVWHCGLENNTMVKCKATSVREDHIRQACGIPEAPIQKALFKAEENLNSDLTQVSKDELIQFVRDELSEEFDKEMVNDIKVKQKTLSVLGKHIRKVVMMEELEQIVERIHNEVGEDVSTADKMRCFAELYPNRKKFSGKVYQALNKIEG